MYKLLIYTLLLIILSTCSIQIVKRYEDPLSAKEHIELGLTYEKQGQTNAAIKQYTLAIKKNRDKSKAYIYLGNILLEQKKYTGAIEAYNQAAASGTNNPDLFNNLAWALMNKGGLTDAYTYASKAVGIGGTRLYLYLDTLGMIQMKLGRTKEARETFEKALKNIPEDKKIRREIFGHLKKAETVKE